MKKHLIVALGLLLLLPGFAFAIPAYNDATLSTDAVIKVGSQSYNVIGSTAAVASIIVGDTSFDVSLRPGSSIRIQSMDRTDMTYSALDYVTQKTCGFATLTIDAGAGVNSTVTVTPTNDVCSSGGFVAPPVVVPPPSGGSPAMPPPAVTPHVVVPPVVVPPVVPPAVTVATPSKVAVAVSPVFSKALAYGVTSSDATRMQKLLALNLGMTIKATGKFDSATRAALMKFQDKYKLAAKGKTGYGVAGPATRAKFAELYEYTAPVKVTPASVSASSATKAAPAMTKAAKTALLKTLLEKIVELQAQLKAMQ